MKFSMKDVADASEIYQSAKAVKSLVNTYGGFRKKLEAALAEKGGERRLWRKLYTLSEFGLELGDAKIEVELEE